MFNDYKDRKDRVHKNLYLINIIFIKKYGKQLKLLKNTLKNIYT